MNRVYPLPLLALTALAGCSLAPEYQLPAMALPATFKEAPGWTSAAPADDVAKGEWWKLFGDRDLDALEAQVAISNQNVAAYAAAYRQAQAAVRESRAGLFPSLDLNGSASRSESFDGGTTGVVPGGSGGTATLSRGTTSSLALGATWQPDLWGRVGNAARQAGAAAQASAGDLRNATLAAQGELASDYFQLRGIDAQAALLAETSAAYDRSLTITRNRFREGVVSQADVFQAETQLRNARAQQADLARQRAIYEHAIAVLVGANPSRFAIAPAAWNRIVPQVPAALPGAIVQRRPDVAAAERRVAAANAAIGVQRAAFFPTLSLSGSAQTSGGALGSLFSAPASLWSLGTSAAQTIFDGGARSARVREALAAYDQAAAAYRQTVLAAFQQTEDGLAAVQVLATVADERGAAATAAVQAQAIAMNQYLAGQTDYTAVVTAQTAALSARQAEVQAGTNRQVATISLIQAIGGSWEAPRAE
jgi:NodT family efflux transporter outer membrane factor (OMF) lipoprotein